LAKLILAVLLLVTFLNPGPADARGLEWYREPVAEKAIATLTQDAIRAHLAGKTFRPRPALPALTAPGGVFVTLSADGYTRGCWGTVHATQATLAEEIAVNAVKALSYDYRQRPIGRRELPGLVAHVSILGPLEPVDSIAALQPRRFGLLVSAPGKGGVLLPGEALTASWPVATCRRKARLGPRERASMYRFRTAVVGPISLNVEE
jgi:AMMECR1 domain-containing protein